MLGSGDGSLKRKEENELNNILKILAIAAAAGKPTNHIKIVNGSWMPLTIEEIGEGPHGYPAISVCHYYEQQGDLMRDPEMCFEIVPDIATGKLRMYPYSFRNDGVGAIREVYGLNDQGRAVTVNLREKKDEASFARLWNRNIADQGFVKAYAASVKGPEICLCGAPMKDGKCSVEGCVAGRI